ncbi:MAG: Fic family protein [Candidatus Micrarchaeales archaeon]
MYIKTIKRAGTTYYYLEHSIREGNRFYKKRKYLGKKLPSNLAKLKEQLIEDLYNEKWYKEFDKIKMCYRKTLAKTPQSVRENNLEAFMVRFTYDTQRIEGSKLSYPDTVKLLIDKKTPENAGLYDIKEAERHREVFYAILKEKNDLSLDTVVNWHRNLFSETKGDLAGKIRKYPVLINRTDFVPPKAERLDDLLEDFFSWYHRVEDEMHPVRLAALVHLKFVTIHPFGDGNGRVSRLMMNFVLNRFGYPMIDVKYTDRFGYYTALKRSNTVDSERIFVEWFFRKYLEANKIT